LEIRSFLLLFQLDHIAKRWTLEPARAFFLTLTSQQAFSIQRAPDEFGRVSRRHHPFPELRPAVDREQDSEEGILVAMGIQARIDIDFRIHRPIFRALRKS